MLRGKNTRKKEKGKNDKGRVPLFSPYVGMGERELEGGKEVRCLSYFYTLLESGGEEEKGIDHEGEEKEE